LFLVSEDWYFVSHRLDLARAVIAAGFEVVVATRVSSHADLIAGAGVKFRPLALDRAGLSPLRDLATLRQIVRIYRQEAPDIVHHVALKPAIYGSLAARLVGIRRIVNALAGLGYVFSSQGPRAKLLRWFIKPALKIALGGRDTRLIVQNSDDLQRTVAEGLVQAHRVRLIRGAGVDPSNYRQVEIARDRPLVILPARLLWEKGVGEFAGAARLLRECGVKARFALVGKPDPANPSSVDPAEIDSWVSDGVIEYWGWRDDMPEVFAQAQIVCLPTSYGEGLPKSLLEAAASGCAIVASDVPGCREIVAHGKTGWLVPARDVNALAKALQQAIEQPALRELYGAEARAQVFSDFSADRVARETIAVYEELMADKIDQRSRRSPPARKQG
jgi:glycosyltransferase involved in cell wall biosynthesis